MEHFGGGAIESLRRQRGSQRRRLEFNWHIERADSLQTERKAVTKSPALRNLGR